MGYIASGFTPDEEKLILDRTAALVATNEKLYSMTAAEETRRRWMLGFGIAGVVFAAVKLGLVAFPMLRKGRVLGGL